MATAHSVGRDRFGLPIRFASVATKKPIRVEKPWGHELWWAETDRYAGKILVVNAGQALSLQYHREKDETSYLLSGKLRLTHGPNAETLSELEVEPGLAWRK
jgi:mannose-6-phosphate isomerase-like protein (cupin superfamily)